MSDHRKLIDEARGFAAGSDSARATLLRDLADALEEAEKAQTPRWEPGDPCGACQSTGTYWNHEEGPWCIDCGLRGEGVALRRIETPEPPRSALAIARNIINQIGDLWSKQIPSVEWVPVRQSTNDELDQFAARLIAGYRPQGESTDDAREGVA